MKRMVQSGMLPVVVAVMLAVGLASAVWGRSAGAVGIALAAFLVFFSGFSRRPTLGASTGNTVGQAAGRRPAVATTMFVVVWAFVAAIIVLATVNTGSRSFPWLNPVILSVVTLVAVTLLVLELVSTELR